MSGRRYLLDTNAIISLLQGNQRLVALLDEASWVGISVISKLEFLGFPRLSAADASLFAAFEAQVETLGLSADDQPLLRNVLSLRTAAKLRLPDAIIAATAITANATLITADMQLRSISSLSAESP